MLDLPTFQGLLSFSQWIHLEAKDHDLEFVQTVLYFATQILNRSEAAVEAATSSRRTTTPSKHGRRPNGGGGCSTLGRAAVASARPGAENGVFHIHPKKVTEVRFLFHTQKLR